MTDNKDVEGTWSEQKRKLKEKFSFLTNADLEYTDGNKEEMMERLQATLGKSKDALRKIIETL